MGTWPNVDSHTAVHTQYILCEHMKGNLMDFCHLMQSHAGLHSNYIQGHPSVLLLSAQGCEQREG